MNIARNIARLNAYVCAAVVLALATASVALAQDSDGVRLFQPSSPWQVDFGNDRCRVVRTFTGGDQSVLIMMSRTVPPDRFTLTIAGLEIPRRRSWNDVEIATVPQGTVIEAQSLRYQASGDWGEAIQIPYIALNFATGWDNDQILEIRRQRSRPIQLQLTQIHALMAAWQECQTDLLVYLQWDEIQNLDIEASTQTVDSERATPPVPIGNPGRWLTDADYPPSAWREGVEGYVHFVLFVSPIGEVTDCSILETSGDSSLDAVVCAALTARARFEPAHDANGEPTRSFYRSAARFQTPFAR